MARTATLAELYIQSLKLQIQLFNKKKRKFIIKELKKYLKVLKNFDEGITL